MSSCCCNNLHCLINHKVVIQSNGRQYKVVICEICAQTIKAIDLRCGITSIFNIDCIDFIEKLN